MGKRKLTAAQIFDFDSIFKSWDEVQEFFQDKKKTLAWFLTDNPNLGGSAPFALILMGREKKLLKIIKSLKAGDGP